MEIGDTICNVYDYYYPGNIKGHVLSPIKHNLYVVLIKSNGKEILDTYAQHFIHSKIVLIEKHTRTYNELR